MRIGLLKKITSFFNELTETLSKAVNNYENIIVIGDLNIDVSDPDKDRNNYLSDFVDTSSLTNLINRNICHNRPNYFQKTSAVVTGHSDFHKMIISCLKTTFKKIPPKKLFSEIIKSLMNKIFYTISINK